MYLPEDQQDHRSHNMWSIAEKIFNKSTHEKRAIYKQENMVSFDDVGVFVRSINLNMALHRMGTNSRDWDVRH